jgi:hypothetical protein
VSSRARLANVLERIADRLDAIDLQLNDRNHGLAAMRTKFGMVTDDHDQALEDHGRRLRVLEGGSNGSG